MLKDSSYSVFMGSYGWRTFVMHQLGHVSHDRQLEKSSGRGVQQLNILQKCCFEILFWSNCWRQKQLKGSRYPAFVTTVKVAFSAQHHMRPMQSANRNSPSPNHLLSHPPLFNSPTCPFSLNLPHPSFQINVLYTMQAFVEFLL